MWRRCETSRPQPRRLEVENPSGTGIAGRGKSAGGSNPSGYQGFRTRGDRFRECGRALLHAGQYHAAREFLDEAAAADPLNAQLRVDVALAAFRDAGPETALSELDTAPAEARNGDYYLLRAELLDTLRRPQEAAEALNQGIQASPTQPDLYLQAALFLVTHGKVQQTVELLTKADEVVPNNPQLWLTRAVGLAILHQDDPAAAALTKMESLWPEWDLPYLVHGVILLIAFGGQKRSPC